MPIISQKTVSEHENSEKKTIPDPKKDVLRGDPQALSLQKGCFRGYQILTVQGSKLKKPTIYSKNAQKTAKMDISSLGLFSYVGGILSIFTILTKKTRFIEKNMSSCEKLSLTVQKSCHRLLKSCHTKVAKVVTRFVTFS